MRVATWNVNNVVRRLDLLLDWLGRTKPDVVALQELKVPTEAFPTSAVQEAGYHALVVGQRTWNGVALLSRRELIPVASALPGDPKDKEARYLEAASSGVLFSCLYLPNGNPQPGPKFDYKMRWFERMRARAAELWNSGQPVVLLGDWNVVPTDSDIYKPDTWRDNALLQPEPRAAFAAVLAQGWTDAIKATHPGQVPFTFWDYRRRRWERDAGLRIDHILLSARIGLKAAGVDREERGRDGPSDHAPVWAEITVKKPGAKSNAGTARPSRAKPAAAPKSARRRNPDQASARVARADKPDLANAVRAALPTKLSPQLATLVQAAPAGGDWIAETKFDGYRLLARIAGGEVRLLTRSGNDWTTKLKSLAREVQAMGIDAAWLDGEIVVLNDAGVPDFNRLQNAIDNAHSDKIVYYVFDVPFLGPDDLRKVPLQSRRAVLRQLLVERGSERVRFSEAFQDSPDRLLEAACKLGLEGVILKDAKAAYVSARTDTWLKLKCQQRQEFVVVGFTDRTGAPKEAGSLLLAYQDAGRLKYAGAVGTGWNSSTRKALHEALSKLRTDKPAVPAVSVKPGRWSRRTAGAEHWVKPQMVVEVAFAEWTPDGHVRHPTFRGVRKEKPTKEIVRERAVAPAAASVPPGSAPTRVTHPDRVIDPSTGLRKIDLVRYYESVAERMLPHLKDRPVSLVRAPRGITGELFFQKHAETRMPGMTELDPALWSGHAALLAVDSAEALVAAAQMNAVEFHTWNSTTRRIDQPDRIVFDLDPGEGVSWPHLQEGALLTRSLLTDLGLDSWLKTSGGKGLHVVVPIAPKREYDEVKDFSQSVVQHMARVIPQRFVAKSGGSNRVGKIFIDYLRNGHSQTTAAAFSARARPGLGVSMPVSWDQLASLKSGAEWTIASAPDYLSSERSDPWANYWTSRQTLTAAMKRLNP